MPEADCGSFLGRPRRQPSDFGSLSFSFEILHLLLTRRSRCEKPSEPSAHRASLESSTDRSELIRADSYEFAKKAMDDCMIKYAFRTRAYRTRTKDSDSGYKGFACRIRDDGSAGLRRRSRRRPNPPNRAIRSGRGSDRHNKRKSNGNEREKGVRLALRTSRCEIGGKTREEPEGDSSSPASGARSRCLRQNSRYRTRCPRTSLALFERNCNRRCGHHAPRKRSVASIAIRRRRGSSPPDGDRETSAAETADFLFGRAGCDACDKCQSDLLSDALEVVLELSHPVRVALARKHIPGREARFSQRETQAGQMRARSLRSCREPKPPRTCAKLRRRSPRSLYSIPCGAPWSRDAPPRSQSIPAHAHAPRALLPPGGRLSICF